MYECPRCQYKCDTVNTFKQHLSKKKICTPILNDIKIEDIDIEECKKDIFLYSCQYCNEKFKLKSSIKRHQNISCKNRISEESEEDSLEYLKKIVDNLNKQIEEKDKIYKEQIQEKDKQISELIKKAGNTITNNNTINVMLSFNNSSMDHITDNDMYACLKSCALSVPNLVQKIHFNPKVPENHNIYITNLKSGYIMVYNGKQWEVKDRNDIIEAMIYKYEYKLEDWCSSEEIQKLFPLALKHLKEYSKKRDKNDNELLSNIKNEIKLLLYNKKDMILNTKKSATCKITE